MAILLTGTIDLVISLTGTVDVFVEAGDVDYLLDFSDADMSMYLGAI